MRSIATLPFSEPPVKLRIGKVGRSGKDGDRHGPGCERERPNLYVESDMDFGGRMYAPPTLLTVAPRGFANLLGYGIQACYRGPRLFDLPETKALVKRWVAYYKQHRDVLNHGDIIHLCRPSGRDWDGQNYPYKE